jgi:membrane protease YdiL (CAAX protease family)
MAAQPLRFVGWLLAGLLLGPLSEELGWRGFALDQLQRRWKPWFASLILGFVWGLWHLPLFLIKGTVQAAWGLGTVRFWLFLIGILPLSLLMATVYNRTRKSILSAILLHFFYNATGNLLSPLPTPILSYQVVLLALVAAVASWLAPRAPST